MDPPFPCPSMSSQARYREQQKCTTPASRRAAFSKGLVATMSGLLRVEEKQKQMERRGLCSVDPRHAVARLLQAMKRADAKEDEKGADCRDGEKARPLLRDVKSYPGR